MSHNVDYKNKINLIKETWSCGRTAGPRGNGAPYHESRAAPLCRKNDQKLPFERVYILQISTQTWKVQTQRGASRPKWGGFNPGMKLLAQNVEFHVCLGALSNAFNAFESVSKRFGRRSQIVGGRLRKHRRAPVHNAIHKESALGSDHHYACQSFLAAARLP